MTGPAAAIPGAQEASVAVVEAARTLSAEGLIEAFGHVSARCGVETFLLTPRRGLSSVRRDELLTLKLEHTAPRGFAVVGGDPAQVPVEAAIHAAIYARRPDVGGIVRDHGFASTLLGLTGIRLGPVHALGAAVRGEVPVHDSAALITSQEEGLALAALLGDGSAVLLRGNGRVIVGASVAVACARAVLLEESARVHVAARAMGVVPAALSEAEQERAEREVASGPQLLRVWDHLRRKHGLEGPG